MILVYDEIERRIREYKEYAKVYAENASKPLIENYKESNLQSASYDIQIESKILTENPIVDTVDLRSKENIENVFEETDISSGYVLKPNEYVLVKMKERINMPDDLCAHIRPRTTFNKLGLIITNQHVNPSYSGTLYIGLKNMTAHGFKIYPDIVVGQLVFETLSGEVRKDKLYRNIKTSKYQGEDNTFIPSKIYDELSEADKKEVDELYKELIEKIKA